MGGERDTAVVCLITLARSGDWRDRKGAGRALAVFADVPQAREPLLALILDPGDTSVTRATAEALLRRQDRAGYALVARALAGADDDHSEWIHTAIQDVFVVYGHERDAAVQECHALLDDADEDVRMGSRRLMTALNALVPVLSSPKPDTGRPG